MKKGIYACSSHDITALNPKVVFSLCHNLILLSPFPWDEERPLKIENIKYFSFSSYLFWKLKILKISFSSYLFNSFHLCLESILHKHIAVLRRQLRLCEWMNTFTHPSFNFSLFLLSLFESYMHKVVTP